MYAFAAFAIVSAWVVLSIPVLFACTYISLDLLPKGRLWKSFFFSVTWLSLYVSATYGVAIIAKYIKGM